MKMFGTQGDIPTISICLKSILKKLMYAQNVFTLFRYGVVFVFLGKVTEYRQTAAGYVTAGQNGDRGYGKKETKTSG